MGEPVLNEIDIESIEVISCGLIGFVVVLCALFCLLVCLHVSINWLHCINTEGCRNGHSFFFQCKATVHEQNQIIVHEASLFCHGMSVSQLYCLNPSFCFQSIDCISRVYNQTGVSWLYCCRDIPFWLETLDFEVFYLKHFVVCLLNYVHGLVGALNSVFQVMLSLSELLSFLSSKDFFFLVDKSWMPFVAVVEKSFFFLFTCEKYCVQLSFFSI